MSDDQARQQIRHVLDQTLFVEAGAGTGKTTALVGRIVELVATGRARLRNIAAITFTEAAAGELRDRVREALEQLAAGHDDDPSGPAPERVERAVEALRELDGAAISTLHGFAQRVLAEHPFEAGLPPTFEVYDQIRSRVAFDERWEAFLDRLLDDPTARPGLQRALVCGITLDHLRQAALEFNRNWDLAEDRPGAVEAPRPVEVGLVIESLTRALALSDGCVAGDDRLLVHVVGLAGYTRRLEQAATDLERLQLLAEAPPINRRNVGQKGNWDGVIEEVREALGRAQDERDAALRTAATQALGELLAAIRGLTLEAAGQRRRDGSLEFHDLLVQARHVVRTRPEVTAQLHATYTHLLIDEFQDTDPIQIELAVRIATDDPAASDKSWQDLSVPPGRLFFVGDPKQAIYRFRRADVGLFLDVRDRQAVTALSLTRNHRSVPGLLDWVNAVFGSLIGPGEAGVQPVYQALDAHRPGASGAHRPPVVLLGSSSQGRNIGDIRAQEATEIADAITRVRDEGWPVGTDGRPATLADVCVLIPTRTSLPSLERALDVAGLPYRVESSSLVYASSEVRDLLNVLRAVDDPTDEVAVVAALRSSWFGCGDDDLLEFRAAAGRWDYRRPSPDEVPADHPVTQGLAALADLHRRRWWHDASGLIEQILVERRAFELGLDERRPRDVWRRLRFVLDQAREFTDAYGTDLRRYLAWADLQRADDARVVEAILPETDDDAVRIMTVHASKGLEFPVVVLSGLNTEYRPRAVGVDVLWGDDGPEVRIRKELETAGYAALAERERRIDEHEQIRLLYVAATRARDHLIVSLHHKATTTPRCHAARLATLVPDHPDQWRRLDPWVQPSAPTLPFPDPDPGPGHRAAAPAALVDEDLDERRRWIDQRDQVLGAAARPGTWAATAVAKLADERDAAEPDAAAEAFAPAEATPWRRGRAGTAIGRAVHAVLQTVDLATGAELDHLARSQAGAEGVPERAAEVARLSRTALDSPIVAQAVSARRHWREVYVGAPVAGQTLEGFVDLLFEDDHGLTVVDYKTDAARTDADLDAAVDRYRLQGASYAVALEQALGRPVTRCVFLFLRAGQAVEREVADLGAAIDEVRALLRSV